MAMVLVGIVIIIILMFANMVILRDRKDPPTAIDIGQALTFPTTDDIVTALKIPSTLEMLSLIHI